MLCVCIQSVSLQLQTFRSEIAKWRDCVVPSIGEMCSRRRDAAPPPPALRRTMPPPAPPPQPPSPPQSVRCAAGGDAALASHSPTPPWRQGRAQSSFDSDSWQQDQWERVSRKSTRNRRGVTRHRRGVKRSKSSTTSDSWAVPGEHEDGGEDSWRHSWGHRGELHEDRG